MAVNLSYSQTRYAHSEGFDGTLPQGMAYADLLTLAYNRTTATYRLPVNLSETSLDDGVDYTLTASGLDAGVHSLTANLFTLGFYY